MTHPTGSVTGWFGARRADSDVVPLSGSVTLSPVDRYTVDLGNDVAGVVFARPVQIQLDAFGWLEEAGDRVIELLTGRYIVSPALMLEGQPYSLRAFPITVRENETTEVARETPNPDPGGIPIIQGIPAGGEIGQTIIRIGPGDYEVAWADRVVAPDVFKGVRTYISTPASTWTLSVPPEITGRLPVVTLYDDDGRIMWTDPPTVTPSTVTVTFANPQTGSAVLS